MTSSLDPKVATLNAIAKFRQYVDTELAPVAKRGEAIQNAADSLDECWSGSVAGYHGALYYRQFESPPPHRRFSVEWGGIRGLPDGWLERRPEEVKNEVERRAGSGLSVDAVERMTKAAREAVDDLQHEVNLALSRLNFGSAGKSANVRSRLEGFKFGLTLRELLQARMPKSVMTRDSEAVMQSTMIPSHWYFAAVGGDTESLWNASKQFLKLADRLTQTLDVDDPGSSPNQKQLDTNRLHPAIVSSVAPSTFRKHTQRLRRKDSRSFATDSEP